MGDLKEKILYEPFSTLEEQEAAEKLIQEEMELEDKKNQDLLKEVENYNEIGMKEIDDIKEKFKLVEVTI